MFSVVDEQNAHTEETELPSPLEFRKDSEEENRDSEKDEDTKELEAVPCKFIAASAAAASACLAWSRSRPVSQPFTSLT